MYSREVVGVTAGMLQLPLTSDNRLKFAHHPRFAAEVVSGEERVDARDAAKMKANDEVSEILARDHTVGMLADQDKVWLE